MNLFSTYHPALIALYSLNDQFKGNLGIYTFCNDKGVHAYMCKGEDQESYTHQEIDISDIKPKIQDFRSLKKEIFWGDKNDLPFVTRSKQIQQLSIQDEIEQNVLIFRVDSANDDISDVFAIEFSKSFSNFYISNSRNNLSSEMKLSIGKTIRNQVVWIYNFYKQQQFNIEKIQIAYQKSIDTVISKNEEISEIKRTNDLFINQYILQLIGEHESKFNCVIKFAPDFLNQLSETGVRLNELNEIIDSACSTAYDLSLDKSNIYLSANLIRPIHSIQDQQNKSHTVQLIGLNKTVELLDKYERAARELDQSNQRINGKNLAKALKISGPAVSDALKNHHKKIHKALEKNPDSWPLITNYIRPIREIKWKLANKNIG
ncbi:site-specific integrase [Crocinitomix catalasitica]|uniref:site-specific integrase n=1 Tax=Crocinitomix catalasitica TaxID=184607 RepID=UPI000483D4E7|nr:site-specific integrase [Crocinitomix catalasitica]